MLFILVDGLLQPELVYQVESGLHAQLLDQHMGRVLHLGTTMSRKISNRVADPDPYPDSIGSVDPDPDPGG
jgi:hypothetical protein